MSISSSRENVKERDIYKICAKIICNVSFTLLFTFQERRYSRNRMEESDMESDSATSGTAASMTSEDISDLSS